jgi:hypothetical protein
MKRPSKELVKLWYAKLKAERIRGRGKPGQVDRVNNGAEGNAERKHVAMTNKELKEFCQFESLVLDLGRAMSLVVGSVGVAKARELTEKVLAELSIVEHAMEGGCKDD